MSPLNLLPPPSAAPLLRAEQVTLEYKGEHGVVRATEDASVDVYAGDRFVLLGPSGGGKSTLLKGVSRFIAPQAGSLSLGVSLKILTQGFVLGVIGSFLLTWPAVS